MEALARPPLTPPSVGEMPPRWTPREVRKKQLTAVALIAAAMAAVAAVN